LARRLAMLHEMTPLSLQTMSSRVPGLSSLEGLDSMSAYAGDFSPTATI
jgi:hypothetical protein